jgi:N-acylneuraminate cytidylyltransferase
MSNIAFIPVRGGSKSIPLKNIKNFAGKPLVYWATYAASKADCIDKVVVATDSEIIKTTILNLSMDKVQIFDRNPKNATDMASTESVMLEYITASNLQPDDFFFLIQATTPTLRTMDIDGVFAKMLFENADSALTGVRTKRFFWLDTGIPLNYDYTKRPRRQDFSGLFMENGACYVNAVANIIRDNNRLSGKICLYEMPEYTGLELDEPDDWLLLETLMQRHSHEN